MADFLSHLWIALALVLVIEGLIYAIFPAQVQNVMRIASAMDKEKLRYYGAGMVALGVVIVWLLQKIIGI